MRLFAAELPSYFTWKGGCKDCAAPPEFRPADDKKSSQAGYPDL
jgi:hypothetical protein